MITFCLGHKLGEDSRDAAGTRSDMQIRGSTKTLDMLQQTHRQRRTTLTVQSHHYHKSHEVSQYTQAGQITLTSSKIWVWAFWLPATHWSPILAQCNLSAPVPGLTKDVHPLTKKRDSRIQQAITTPKPYRMHTPKSQQGILQKLKYAYLVSGRCIPDPWFWHSAS